MIILELGFGFGDCLFMLPVAKKLNETDDVVITTHPRNFDAFYNIDGLKDILPSSPKRGNGNKWVEAFGDATYYNLTQHYLLENVFKFAPLLEIPYCVGKTMGVTIETKPIYKPTEEEIENTKLPEGKYIAIESGFNSYQSWTSMTDWLSLTDKAETKGYQVIWLSNREPPKRDNVVDTTKWSRREHVIALRHCETLFTSGSGFCAAAAALDKKYQPDKMVVGIKEARAKKWKVKRSYDKYNWHDNVEWVWYPRNILDFI